jgi:hypothetical protein
MNALLTLREKEIRLAICQSCPELIVTGLVCRKCACDLNRKLWMRTAECPLKKW